MDASFQLNSGGKLRLVGPTGSGKTTLFRMVVVVEVLERQFGHEYNSLKDFRKVSGYPTRMRLIPVAVVEKRYSLTRRTANHSYNFCAFFLFYE